MTTAIEWTDTTWNPTTGCDRVSPGCDHCYALTMAKRLKGMGQAKYQRDGDPRTSGPGFGITEHWETLTEPLRWRKPRRVFVNSMSDLFHQDVSREFLASVWAVMAATPQHTYQVLTKRHARMRSVLRDECTCHAHGTHFWSAMMWAASANNPRHVPGLAPDMIRGTSGPLPNVWLGVSVEDQKRAALRVPALLETPAAVRFLSCEPLLGEVDLFPWLHDSVCDLRTHDVCTCAEPREVHANWVIVGGESGPGARPMHPAWARSLRDQCTRAGVPYFFKQWGDFGPTGHMVATKASAWEPIEEVARLGKKATGRELDGRTWDEYPASRVLAGDAS